MLVLAAAGTGCRSHPAPEPKNDELDKILERLEKMPSGSPVAGPSGAKDASSVPIVVDVHIGPPIYPVGEAAGSGQSAAPSGRTRARRAPAQTPQERFDRACAALWSKCDGHTWRSDLCVRQMPACASPTPWENATWPCCPRACIDAYMKARRLGQSVEDAAVAFTGEGHPCRVEAVREAEARGAAAQRVADALAKGDEGLADLLRIATTERGPAALEAVEAIGTLSPKVAVPALRFLATTPERVAHPGVPARARRLLGEDKPAKAPDGGAADRPSAPPAPPAPASPRPARRAPPSGDAK